MKPAPLLAETVHNFYTEGFPDVTILLSYIHWISGSVGRVHAAVFRSFFIVCTSGS